MKKNSLIFFTAFLAVVGLVYIGCKKEKLINGEHLGIDKGSVALTASNPSIADSSIIERQLRWIARGIPDMAQNNYGVRGMVENLCLSRTPLFFDLNENIQTNLDNGLSVNYQNSVYFSVNSRFPSNDFDSSIFYQFEYRDCKFLIGLAIPELDICDTSKQFIVLPTHEFNYGTDNYGYFLNGANLDSVIIDEDNIDDYYVWVVSVYDLCVDGFGMGGSSSSEPCDGDGVCEEEYGEDSTNCADCSSNNTVNGKISGRKELFILDLKSVKDVLDKNSSSPPTEDFQEKHLQFKYDILAAYAIIDTSTVSSRGNPHKKVDLLNLDDGPGRRVEALWDASAWGANCDIKRCKTKSNGNSSCNRGIENKFKNVDRLIFQNYNHLAENVYLILYEYDGGIGHKDHSIHDIDGIIPSSTNTELRERARQKAWTSGVVGGTNTEILKIKAPGSSPTSNGWIATTKTINGRGRNGFTKTFQLDGEMEITLGFFD
jgi:hypothetical protein